MINPSIFKAYDIRGIYPKDINENNFADIIKALYVFLSTDTKKRTLKIVLGRDMRLSSPSLFAVAKKSLLEIGAEIIDIGLVSTPTVYSAALQEKSDVGIQISASHNPKEYNGIKAFKVINGEIVKISKIYGMAQVKKLALSGVSDSFSKQKGKYRQASDALDNEVKRAFNLVKPKLGRKLKVVVDPANSMGGPMVQAVCQKAGINLVKINFNLDGNFPAHQADPLQFETLKDLQSKVLSEKADFGVALDGDADRLFFIDEKGKVIPATLISSLVTHELLSKNSQAKIIVDIRYVGNVSQVCAKFNKQPSICQVGHALITDQLNRERANFAGESSGHYFFKETGGAESAARVLVYAIDALNEKNQPLSQIVNELKSWEESGESNYVLNEGATANDLLKLMKKTYIDGQLSTLDGIAISYTDWRFVIRSSNTEPLIRLNVEGKNSRLVVQKVSELKEKIISFGAHQKDE